MWHHLISGNFSMSIKNGMHANRNPLIEDVGYKNLKKNTGEKNKNGTMTLHVLDELGMITIYIERYNFHHCPMKRQKRVTWFGKWVFQEWPIQQTSTLIDCAKNMDQKQHLPTSHIHNQITVKAFSTIAIVQPWWKPLGFMIIVLLRSLSFIL